MKICVIANPTAGSADKPEALGERYACLPGAEIHVTKAPGEAAEFARQALDDGVDTIVVAGGDGTLNEIVNAVAPTPKKARLALVPSGTGNDFARILGLPDDPDACVQTILAGKTRAIDLVQVTSDCVRYFLNVSAGGFSGLVDGKLTPELKKTWGPLAYVRCAAAALPELRAYEASITLDDVSTVSRSLYNVIVANGRYVAGGIPVAPEASIDDGLLDVVLVPEMTGPEMAIFAAQLLLGNHLQDEKVLFRRAAKVAVHSVPGMWFNVDGELVGNEPAVFECLPRALEFLVGEPK